MCDTILNIDCLRKIKKCFRIQNDVQIQNNTLMENTKMFSYIYILRSHVYQQRFMYKIFCSFSNIYPKTIFDAFGQIFFL